MITLFCTCWSFHSGLLLRAVLVLHILAWISSTNLLTEEEEWSSLKRNPFRLHLKTFAVENIDKNKILVWIMYHVKYLIA